MILLPFFIDLFIPLATDSKQSMIILFHIPQDRILVRIQGMPFFHTCSQHQFPNIQMVFLFFYSCLCQQFWFSSFPFHSGNELKPGGIPKRMHHWVIQLDYLNLLQQVFTFLHSFSLKSQAYASSSAQRPLATSYFFSSETRKSLLFHRNHMLVDPEFHGL